MHTMNSDNSKPYLNMMRCLRMRTSDDAYSAAACGHCYDGDPDHLCCTLQLLRYLACECKNPQALLDDCRTVFVRYDCADK